MWSIKMQIEPRLVSHTLQSTELVPVEVNEDQEGNNNDDNERTPHLRNSNVSDELHDFTMKTQ